MTLPNPSLGLWSGLLTFVLVWNGWPPEGVAGELEDYVGAPDTHYTWREADRLETNGLTITHLEMTSQEWRGNLWTHHMQIVRPARIRNADIAFLFVTGDGEGKSSIPLLALLAERAGAVAAVVTRVPNQPLYDGRKEDALIAYTFDQYLKTGDATWPALFPMTKSAVRALDTVQQFAQKQGGQQLTRFVVSGASKRGWTTWLTAAVDRRVAGIAPMVIDTLNMKKQVEWAEKCYGRQSERINDYTRLNLHLNLDEPGMIKLRNAVDPYSYRERYNIPKLLLLGTNDPYWTVDSLRHYWNDLPEPKLVFQTPNAGHDLGDRKDAYQTLAAFFQMVSDRQPLPRFTWKFKSGPAPEVSLEVKPDAKVTRLWSSESVDRDFRNELWIGRVLQHDAGRANGRLVSPPTGYRAYLAEVTLISPTGDAYKLSTEARVLPETFREQQ